MKGTVRWYNESLGVGFITGDDDKDYRFGRDEIGYAVEQGDYVEFDEDVHITKSIKKV